MSILLKIDPTKALFCSEKPKVESVIDDKGKFVHEGGTGELYVSGIGVTRGYIGEQALTGLQYNTGDLVRILPDGLFEYVGRKDHLIKVNGCRVDIHLIENKILAIPNISEAVVIAMRTEGDKSILACFYSGLLEDAKILKRHLRKLLPLFKIPTQYYHLDKLPQLSNGKINREKLKSELNTCRINPRYLLSDFESELGKIWQKLLGEAPTSYGDDFFQMGGDSLLAVQLIIEIEKKWDVEVLAPDLLDHSTLKELAQLIALRRGAVKRQTVIPIETNGKGIPLFLVHPSIGLADCYRPLSEHLKDQPIYGIQNPFLVHRSRCFSSLSEMAAHYCNEIKQVCPIGPYVIGGWSFGGVVALEIASIFTKSGDSVDRVILLDSYAPQVDVEEALLSIHSEDLLVESRNNAKLLRNHRFNGYDGAVHLIRAGNGLVAQ